MGDFALDVLLGSILGYKIKTHDNINILYYRVFLFYVWECLD